MKLLALLILFLTLHLITGCTSLDLDTKVRARNVASKAPPPPPLPPGFNKGALMARLGPLPAPNFVPQAVTPAGIPRMDPPVPFFDTYLVRAEQWANHSLIFRQGEQLPALTQDIGFFGCHTETQWVAITISTNYQQLFTRAHNDPCVGFVPAGLELAVDKGQTAKFSDGTYHLLELQPSHPGDRTRRFRVGNKVK